MGPRRHPRRYRLPLRSAGQTGFYVRQQVRVLRIYLGGTTFLLLYGVVFTVFPLRRDLTYANPAGGIVGVCLGAAALAWLAVRPERPNPGTAAAILAIPIVMAFHRAIVAEFVCLIGPMFLTMYLRAFYPARRGIVLVAVLTGACVLGLAVAPTPKLSIDYLIFVIAIIGAGESFGLVMRSLVTAACTDPLTGVLNRAGWEIATADLSARFRSASATITVVAMDIDNFKRINDTEGHLAGDQHLVSRAGVWRELTPGNAVLARLGGDEFAACIAEREGPNESATTAARRFVADVRIHTPGTSVGIASCCGATADIRSLFAAADRDLYDTKQKRLADTRDWRRTCTWGEKTPDISP